MLKLNSMSRHPFFHGEAVFFSFLGPQLPFCSAFNMCHWATSSGVKADHTQVQTCFSSVPCQSACLYVIVY